MKKIILITALLISYIVSTAQLKIGTTSKDVKSYLESLVAHNNRADSYGRKGDKIMIIEHVWNNGEIVEIDLKISNAYYPEISRFINYVEKYIMKNGRLDCLRIEYFNLSISELKNVWKNSSSESFFKADNKGDYYLDSDTLNYNYILLGENNLATHILKRISNGGFTKETLSIIKDKNSKLIQEREKKEFEKKEKKRLEDEAYEKAKYPKYGAEKVLNKFYFVQVKGNGKRLFMKGHVNYNVSEYAKQFRSDLKKIYYNNEYVSEEVFKSSIQVEEYEIVKEILDEFKKKDEYLIQVIEISQSIQEWKKPQYITVKKRVTLNKFYFEEFYLFVGELLKEKDKSNDK